MTQWMQPIKTFGKKKIAEPHGVPETRGTRCHECPSLSCIAQRSRREPWRFYCDAASRRVYPSKVKKRECPIGRKVKGGVNGD